MKFPIGTRPAWVLRSKHPHFEKLKPGIETYVGQDDKYGKLCIIITSRSRLLLSTSKWFDNVSSKYLLKHIDHDLSRWEREFRWGGVEATWSNERVVQSHSSLLTALTPHQVTKVNRIGTLICIYLCHFKKRNANKKCVMCKIWRHICSSLSMTYVNNTSSSNLNIRFSTLVV